MKTSLQLRDRSPVEMGVRRAFRDHRGNMMTYDRVMTHDGQGNSLGRPFAQAYTAPGYRTRDGRFVDQRVYDSSGAFMVGELERLDQTMHAPLVAVSWHRDIDIRNDVTLGDEISSFTLSTFASQGGLGAGNGIGTGKAWAGKKADQVASVGIDIAKTPNPLNVWALEIAYTVLELESAAQTGRPIDQQKYNGLQLKYQMDVDEQVYIGDTSLGQTGLVNAAGVSVTNVPAGALGLSTWANKNPDEILADVNTALTTVWANSGWAVMPSCLRIPPAQYGQICTQKVSLAGNMSVLKYILENNVTTKGNGSQLSVEPVKWLIGAGAGGTIGTTGTVDRMLVYTKDRDRVRFPMTALSRTPLQYDSLWQKCTYYGRLGVVEVVYPDTLGYFDGI